MLFHWPCLSHSIVEDDDVPLSYNHVDAEHGSSLQYIIARWSSFHRKNQATPLALRHFTIFHDQHRTCFKSGIFHRSKIHAHKVFDRAENSRGITTPHSTSRGPENPSFQQLCRLCPAVPHGRLRNSKHCHCPLGPLIPAFLTVQHRLQVVPTGDVVIADWSSKQHQLLHWLAA